MPKTRLIAINGSAGAYVQILSSIPARRAEGREDESATAQGLTYQKPDDGFVATYTVGVPGTPDAPQIVLGNPVGQGAGEGPILGWPAQSGLLNTTATQLVNVRSKTATGTNLRFAEYE